MTKTTKEPTTEEAFATVREALNYSGDANTAWVKEEAARSALALLERRMGAMERAVDSVLAEFDDARLSELFSLEAHALRGLRSALTDAPPVFTLEDVRGVLWGIHANGTSMTSDDIADIIHRLTTLRR